MTARHAHLKLCDVHIVVSVVPVHAASCFVVAVMNAVQWYAVLILMVSPLLQKLLLDGMAPCDCSAEACWLMPKKEVQSAHAAQVMSWSNCMQVQSFVVTATGLLAMVRSCYDCLNLFLQSFVHCRKRLTLMLQWLIQNQT